MFHQANQLKPKKQRVKNSEFYNDALNKDVDLKKQAVIFYQEWNQAKKQGKEFDRHSFFTLYNYPWTLNAYKKAELFRIISSQERYDQIGQSLLNNIFSNPNIGDIINNAHFSIKIRREAILEDSLNNLI